MEHNNYIEILKMVKTNKQMFKSSFLLSIFWNDKTLKLQTMHKKNVMFIYFVNKVAVRKR